MLRINILILIQFIVLSLLGQEMNIKGKVQEDLSHSNISYANVYLKHSKMGCYTSKKGDYSLTFPDSLKIDTLIVSALGYKQHAIALSSVSLDSNYNVLLQDSMFVLDEVIAFGYDYIEGFYWKGKRNGKNQYLLSYVSKDLLNVGNFVILLNERLGKSKRKKNTIVWKKLRIPGLKGKTKLFMKYFRCEYGPRPDNISVTFNIDNSEIEDALLDSTNEAIVTNYLQEILDQTFENGINIAQLEKRKRIYYLPNSELPYNGKIYGYFDSGEKGMRGRLKDGKKDLKWEYWFKSQKKRMIINFDAGKKDGLMVAWFKNGNLRIKNEFVKGRLVGNNFWWHENGTLKKVAHYENGIVKGALEWEKDGYLKIQDGFFKNISETEVQDIKAFRFNDKKIAKYILKYL